VTSSGVHTSSAGRPWQNPPVPGSSIRAPGTFSPRVNRMGPSPTIPAEWTRVPSQPLGDSRPCAGPCPRAPVRVGAAPRVDPLSA
jgi:hypothetical protein